MKVSKKILAEVLIGTMLFNLNGSTVFLKTNKAEAAGYELQNPVWNGNVSTWDCVWFGNYWQEDTNGDGVADVKDKKQPIKWRVLNVDKEKNEVFLLSDKCLDCKRYYRGSNEKAKKVTWENSTVRSWLNGYDASQNKNAEDFTSDNFLKNAFSAAEQKVIQQTTVTNSNGGYGNDTTDKIFLLSKKETSTKIYGFGAESGNEYPSRQVKDTAYAMEQMGVDGDAKYYGFGWWLRWPHDNQSLDADFVYGDTGKYEYTDKSEEIGVRPALKVNLNSVSYAGTVSSNEWVEEGDFRPQNPKWSTSSGRVSTWDCVWFGKYWQEDTNRDGVADKEDKKQPIKWRVLNVNKEEDEILLLADKNLDYKQYDTTYQENEVCTWEDSVIRSWLNGYGSSKNKEAVDYTSDNFLKEAFSAEEQKEIKQTKVCNTNASSTVRGQYSLSLYNLTGAGERLVTGSDTMDRIYLLSWFEVQNVSYGFEVADAEQTHPAHTRKAKDSAFVSEVRKKKSPDNWTAEKWFLRTIYRVDSNRFVYYTNSGGACLWSLASMISYAGIRPVLKLKLSSAISSRVFSYAGTVSSNGTMNEILPESGLDTSEDDIPEITPYEDPAEPLETGAPVSKFFKDHTYQQPVKEDSITLYANGGTVAKAGGKKNYKSCTLYTKILPSYIYTKDKKGELKTAAGKVVVGITGTDQKPSLVKGKIVDADAAKVAKASIKNGQITITAQSRPGNVYLWVMDTGDLSKSVDPDEATGTFCCCPVTVKMAPIELQTYNKAKEEVVPGTTPKYTSKTLDLLETTDVYVCPLYKDGKEKKKTSDGTYSVEVESKSADYFEAVKTGPEKFTVRAIGLKDNKTTKGKIIIKNDQNQKKTTFTVTAVNHVKRIAIEKPSAVTLDQSTGIINIGTSSKGKISGTVTASLTKARNSFETTDVPKIYAMKTADGYDQEKFKNGTVSIKAQPASAQKKITASIAKNKQTITISTEKGTKAGQTVYFLLVYNTNDVTKEKGHKILTVRTQ